VSAPSNDTGQSAFKLTIALSVLVALAGGLAIYYVERATEPDSRFRALIGAVWVAQDGGTSTVVMRSFQLSKDGTGTCAEWGNRFPVKWQVTGRQDGAFVIAVTYGGAAGGRRETWTVTLLARDVVEVSFDGVSPIRFNRSP
jgi:hypothetical protein